MPRAVLTFGSDRGMFSASLPPRCRARTLEECAVNVVVLRGHLARPAEQRVLPSGELLVAYEVTIPRPGERAETVPGNSRGRVSPCAEQPSDSQHRKPKTGVHNE